MHNDELDPIENEGAERGLDEETLDDFLEDEGPVMPESAEEEEQ